MSEQKKPRVSRKTKEEAPNEESSYVNNKISLDELIPVMSLIDYPLNLLTSGKKAKHRFQKFGETKSILYQDILRIIEEYVVFMEQGMFIILDSRVVNRHGLQELFSKVLKKESIEKILAGSADAVELYNTCSPEQKRVVEGMITRKISKNDESVPSRIVDQIIKISGNDLRENAKDIIFAQQNKTEGVH